MTSSLLFNITTIAYLVSMPMPSMDKQLLVDYLESLDSPDSIPHFPQEMFSLISQKYHEAFKRIVGERSYSRFAGIN